MKTLRNIEEGVVCCLYGSRWQIFNFGLSVYSPLAKTKRCQKQAVVFLFFYMFCKQNECKPFEYKDPSKIRVLYLRQKSFLGVVYGTNVTIHVRTCDGKM